MTKEELIRKAHFDAVVAFRLRRVEQVIGRESETATFFWLCLFNSNGLGGCFAPRYRSR
jgi:hypothetical protein